MPAWVVNADTEIIFHEKYGDADTVSPKEVFVLSGAGAVFLLILFWLVMFYRLSRRKDFGRLWARSVFPIHETVPRAGEKTGYAFQEAKSHLTSVFGACHLLLFLILAGIALFTGLTHEEIFEVLE